MELQPDSSTPASDHKQSNGVERSNVQVTSVASAVPGTEGSVLADTLNQLLHATPGVSVGFLDNPASPVQSNIDTDTALLAHLAPSGTSGGGETATKADQRRPTTAGEGSMQTASPELNSSQLTSSVINPSLGTPVSKSGPLVESGDYQGSIMDQIDPPTVLPDLNLVMAEGMSSVATTNTHAGGVCTTVDTIPLASAIQSVSSGVPVDRSSGTVNSMPGTGPVTVQLQEQQSSTVGQGISRKSNSVASAASVPSPATQAVLPPHSSLASPAVQEISPQSATDATKVVYTVKPSPTPLPASNSASAVTHTLPVSAAKPAATSPSQLSLSVGSTSSRFPPPCAITPLSRPNPSTISPLPTSTPPQLSAAAKGLNLPLLQFLNLNFPSLKVKDLQDVLSINTLLTQVLKQQLNNPASSAAATLQQLMDVSKPDQSASSLPSLATVQSSTSGTRVSGTQLVLPRTTVSSSVASGPSLLGLQTGLSTSSRPSSALTATGSLKSLPFGAGVKPMTAQPLTVDGKAQSASSSGLGINLELFSKQSSSLLSTLASPSAPSPSTTASSRKAVLVQILNKTSTTTPTTVTTTPPSKSPIMIPRMKSLSKSPLILNRHNRGHQQQSPAVATASPHTSVSKSSTPTLSTGKHSPPVSSLCVSLSLPALRGSQQQEPIVNKRRTPSRKSAHQTTTDTSQQQLNRTVVQPAESEAMEVDVGQPIQRMKLPTHLKDHSYSLFNTEEAEKQRIISASNFSFISSIPPTRLSYAPQVPDSPSTLHKLLKVLPKKNSRQTNSPPHSGRGLSRRGRGGRRGGRNQGKGRGKSSAKKVGPSTPILLTVSEPSSSDQSDSEEHSGKVKLHTQFIHTCTLQCT